MRRIEKWKRRQHGIDGDVSEMDWPANRLHLSMASSQRDSDHMTERMKDRDHGAIEESRRGPGIGATGRQGKRLRGRNKRGWERVWKAKHKSVRREGG